MSDRKEIINRLELLKQGHQFYYNKHRKIKHGGKVLQLWVYDTDYNLVGQIQTMLIKRIGEKAIYMVLDVTCRRRGKGKFLYYELLSYLSEKLNGYLCRHFNQCGKQAQRVWNGIRATVPSDELISISHKGKKLTAYQFNWYSSLQVKEKYNKFM